MRWNSSETEKFVELYRDHECLWDVTKLSYKNHSARLRALEKIVKDMGIDGFTVADARQKVKSLRNTYAQELQKIEKSSRPGMGPDELYTPSVKWFKVMDSFMKKVKEKKLMEANVKIEEDREEEVMQDTTDEDYGTNEETHVTVTRTVPLRNKRAAPPAPQYLSIAKKRRAELSMVVSELRQVAECLKSRTSERDEYEVFGKYMALSLQKLPISLAIECQNELQATISRYRLMGISSHFPDEDEANLI